MNVELEYEENAKVNGWIEEMIKQNKTGFMREIITGYEMKTIREKNDDEKGDYDFDYGCKLIVPINNDNKTALMFMGELIAVRNDDNVNSFDYIFIRLDNERKEIEKAAKAAKSSSSNPPPQEPEVTVQNPTYSVTRGLPETYEQFSFNSRVLKDNQIEDHVKIFLSKSPYKSAYSIPDDREVLEVTLDEVKLYLSKIDFFSAVDRRSTVPLILDSDIDMKKILSYIQT